ncbi:MAG: HAD-IA family hydrolase [Spongiibacteraceae bacterium]|jgi:phosphoglycolate phosphatase|nr:HAD-IA family hydrolase [Spongiibacteraceae bacterium]
MSPTRAVLFDLDGTLIDTAPDFVVVLNRLLERHGQQPLAAERIRQTVSDGAGALVTLGFGVTAEDPRHEPLRQQLLELYGTHLAVESQLFAGMEQLLDALDAARIAWGVVTNKPLLYADPLMRALALDTRCGTLICPDHVQRRKPDPEALLLACERLGASPVHSIYVGDHRRDIEAGQRAGMVTIACTYGYILAHDPCHGWGADYVIDTPNDLFELLGNELRLSVAHRGVSL